MMNLKGFGRFVVLVAICAAISACGASIDKEKGQSQAEGAKLSFIWPYGYSLNRASGRIISPSFSTVKLTPEYVTKITLTISGEGMDTIQLDVPLDTLYVSATVPFGVRRFDVVVESSLGGSFTGSQTVEIVPHMTADVVIELEVNAPPIVDVMDISNTNPLAGETVALSASAHDMDPDDILSYRWEITGPNGVKTWTGQNVSITFPVTGGEYLIAIVVEDGHGGVTRMEKSVRLSGNPPVIRSINLSNPTPSTGETVTIWADVTDPDPGDTFIYYWTFTMPTTGALQMQGSPVSFTFNETGSYTIDLAVQDQQKNITKATTTVSVGCSYPTPQAPSIISASSPSTGIIKVDFTYPGSPVTDGIAVYNLQFYESTSMTGTPLTNSGWIGSIATASPITYTCGSGKYYQFQVSAGNYCYVAGPMSTLYPPSPTSWILCM